MTRPNLNAVAIVDEIFDGEIASTGFDVLRSAEIDSRWLYYMVRSPAFISSMTELVQGALYPAIKSADVRNYEMPLAPFPEQKRIADKLDSGGIGGGHRHPGSVKSARTCKKYGNAVYCMSENSR